MSILSSLLSSVTSSSSATFSIDGLTLSISSDSSDTGYNVLNNYINTQYHCSLTMLSQTEAKRFQNAGTYTSTWYSTNSNTMTASSNTSTGITLASTGDNVTDISSGRNYYAINRLAMSNIMEPSKENPMITTMFSMKMQIVEPYGLKLVEDIRDTATDLGYDEITPGRILYRVSIWFSGFNPNTGTWTDFIEMNGNKVIEYVCLITGIEANLGTTGTAYDVDLMPAGSNAFRPEDITVDASTIQSGDTFKDFLTNLAQILNEAKSKRTDDQITRNFEFYAPSVLMESAFEKEEFSNDNKTVSDADTDNHIITHGRGIDLMTILRGAIANTTVGQTLFNADDGNDTFTTPRILFGVRFNSIYGASDSTLYDYSTITHQFILEPFVSYKQGPVTRDNISTFTSTAAQTARLNKMKSVGMIKRTYNYLFTPNNVDVIDLKLNMKAFYYNTLNIPKTTSATGRHTYSGNSNNILSTLSNIQTTYNTVSDLLSGNLSSTISSLLSSASSLTSSRSGPSVLGGGFNDSPDLDFFGDTVSPSESARATYDDGMEDYMGLDFIQLDPMTIRGDPIWLFSPYGSIDLSGYSSYSDVTSATSGTSTGNISSITARQGAVIYLRVVPPEQSTYMSSSNTSGSTAYASVIRGFYQVYQVDSVFENGTFKQNLHATKITNLNYAEATADSSNTTNFNSSS